MTESLGIPRRIILIGPPGAGKSTVGGLLARELGIDFTDTDHEIEERTGKRISEIFVEDGEPHFRKIEEEVVLQSLLDARGVIALGGGAVMSEVAEKRIGSLKSEGDCEVIFLDVTIAYAAPRVGFNRERPLLLVNPRASWQELMNKRRPIYSRLATRIVDTNEDAPDQVVAKIISGWR
jgi:shikimate kinase